MSDKVYVGNKAQSLKVGQEYEPFSRVTMYYDDEHYFTAGDDTGREMVLNCRSATQEIVDYVLASIKGFVYRPFEATGVQLDMAAELGDGITIGGQYFMIAQMTQHFDAMGLCDVSAPGEKEIDHEYPYIDPTTRELKRRVKLGQKYQGVSITRRDGLTIVEVQEDGGEGAKVVLNSKELSFYDAGGGRVLYFDPTSGTYKFLGELNVNDKFVVDRNGNVTLAGNIYMTGDITWGKGPVQYKFAPAMTGPWHDTMKENDKYRRDSLDGGTTWGDPYQFKGEDGRDGMNGSDATINYNSIKAALQKAASLPSAFMTVDALGAPSIYGGKIYGAEMYANEFNVYPLDTKKESGGFNIHGTYNGSPYQFLQIEYSAKKYGGYPAVMFNSPGGAMAYWAIPTRVLSSISFGDVVDFNPAIKINWGKNAPVAVFGGDDD